MDCKCLQGSHPHPHSQVCQQDGRSTPYRNTSYEEARYSGAQHRSTPAPEYPTPSGPAPPAEPPRPRERIYSEPRRAEPEVKRPPIVPLPAFQQAFGSTEIGKFAEAFSRTEVALDDATDSFAFESFPEWDPPAEPQWSSQPASREIKCEDNF